MEAKHDPLSRFLKAPIYPRYISYTYKGVRALKQAKRDPVLLTLASSWHPPTHSSLNENTLISLYQHLHYTYI